jgi:hypothetical protein
VNTRAFTRNDGVIIFTLLHCIRPGSVHPQIVLTVMVQIKIERLYRNGENREDTKLSEREREASNF